MRSLNLLATCLPVIRGNPEASADYRSVGYLVALAGRLVREAAAMARRGGRAKQMPTDPNHRVRDGLGELEGGSRVLSVGGVMSGPYRLRPRYLAQCVHAVGSAADVCAARHVGGALRLAFAGFRFDDAASAFSCSPWGAARPVLARPRAGYSPAARSSTRWKDLGTL